MKKIIVTFVVILSLFIFAGCGTNSTDQKASEKIAATPTALKQTERTETPSQMNARKAAENYISLMAFSRDGLIKQLEYEKYNTADAEYGADNCGADWFEQAKKSAETYLETMPFSRDGLIEQLVFDGFTEEQAKYAADQAGL